MRAAQRMGTAASLSVATLGVIAAAVAWLVRPGNQVGDESGTYVFAIAAGLLGAAGVMGGAFATSTAPRRGAVAVLMAIVAMGAAAAALLSLHLLPNGI